MGTGQLHVEDDSRSQSGPTTRRTTTAGDDQHFQATRSKRKPPFDEQAGKDDIILKLGFDLDPDSKTQLADEYGDLPSVDAGLRAGMRLRMPFVMSKLLVEDEHYGPLEADTKSGTRYSFCENYLTTCRSSGIDQMICIPSGGGNKYEKAYLDYSCMLTPTTAHILGVFVKPEEAGEYRKRYPELILIELPDRKKNLPKIEQIAKVGDARFWIKAFVTQLRRNAEKASANAASAFFQRCFMLDDDVICLHNLQSTPDKPCKLEDMLRSIRHDQLLEKYKRAPLIGFHCRRRPGSQRPEPWTTDSNLSTALATALSVSTLNDVPQFHPYASLGEDVGFDQALRLAKVAGQQPSQQNLQPRFAIASVKCNLFSYTRANSGDIAGANREPDGFANALVDKFKAIGFDPAVKIDHSGTYPLLPSIHAWTWQKVKLGENAPFKSTHFLFTRPDEQHMGRLRDASVKQGVLIFLSDQDLPCSDAGIAFPEAVELFRRKLKYPGLVVATKEALVALPDPHASGLSDCTEATHIDVPWGPPTPTTYCLCKLQPQSPVFPVLKEGGKKGEKKEEGTQQAKKEPRMGVIDWKGLYSTNTLPRSVAEARTAREQQKQEVEEQEKAEEKEKREAERIKQSATRLREQLEDSTKKALAYLQQPGWEKRLLVDHRDIFKKLRQPYDGARHLLMQLKEKRKTAAEAAATLESQQQKVAKKQKRDEEEQEEVVVVALRKAFKECLQPLKQIMAAIEQRNRATQEETEKQSERRRKVGKKQQKQKEKLRAEKEEADENKRRRMGAEAAAKIERRNQRAAKKQKREEAEQERAAKKQKREEEKLEEAETRQEKQQRRSEKMAAKDAEAKQMREATPEAERMMRDSGQAENLTDLQMKALLSKHGLPKRGKRKAWINTINAFWRQDEESAEGAEADTYRSLTVSAEVGAAGSEAGTYRSLAVSVEVGAAGSDAAGAEAMEESDALEDSESAMEESEMEESALEDSEAADDLEDSASEDSALDDSALDDSALDDSALDDLEDSAMEDSEGGDDLEDDDDDEEAGEETFEAAATSDPPSDAGLSSKAAGKRKARD